jgi:hypothetical protein
MRSRQLLASKSKDCTPADEVRDCHDKVLGVDMAESGGSDADEAAKSDELEFDVEEVEFDVRTPEPVMREGIANEYRYAKLGLIVGALAMAVGAVFIVLGYTGSVDITFQSGSSKGHIVTGSLGIVIALIGAGVLVWTRPKVRITGQKERSKKKKKKD